MLSTLQVLILEANNHASADGKWPDHHCHLLFCSLSLMVRLQGLPAVEAENERKQAKLYAALEEAEVEGVLRLGVRDGARSWMNVVFRGKDADTEKAFLEAGDKKGFKAMKGHR